MRHLAIALCALLAAAQAGAATEGVPQHCTNIGTLIEAQTMESSRIASKDLPNIYGYGVLALWVSLIDANTSITRLDVICTVSDDGNTTDYEPQDCTTSAGVSTCVDGGVWQKAAPGTTKFPLRVDLNGFPDFECTFAVGTGIGAAADLLTVKGRICVD